jgi:hypothetical protein
MNAIVTTPTAKLPAPETRPDTACGKCHSPILRLDYRVLAWTGGRLVRLSCMKCGWDWHEWGAPTAVSPMSRPRQPSRADQPKAGEAAA